MPFGLKNAEATYQKLVNIIFEDLIGNKVESYIDDMVVKKTLITNHLDDVHDIFDHINPLKYSFGLTMRRCFNYLMT